MFRRSTRLESLQAVGFLHAIDELGALHAVFGIEQGEAAGVAPVRERNLERVADSPHGGHVVQHGLLVGLQVVGAELVDNHRDIVFYGPFLCRDDTLEDGFHAASPVVVLEAVFDVRWGALGYTEVGAVFGPFFLVVGEHEVLDGLGLGPAGALVREYKRFVGMDGVDDVVVIQRFAFRKYRDGVPFRIAKDDGVLCIDCADGVYVFLGGCVPGWGFYGAVCHVGLVQEFVEDVFALVACVVSRHVLPNVGHHLDVPCVLGTGDVVAVVVFVVVDYERHVVLAGPFHEGVEYGEQVLVVELEFDGVGSVGHEFIAIGGVAVEVDGEAQRLDSVFGHELHVALVEFEFALEVGLVFFKPVGDVDTLVEVLHRLFLERTADGEIFGDYHRGDNRVQDCHVGLVLRDFTRVLEVEIVNREGVGNFVALRLEADGPDVEGIECDFFTPAALGQVLEADGHLLPFSGCGHGCEMHVVVRHVGGFHVDFVLAALVPVADAAKIAAVDSIGNKEPPAHVRVVGVIALVERVVDGKCVQGAVVCCRGERVALLCYVRGRDNGCAAVVVIVVSVPARPDECAAVTVFEVVDEQARSGDRRNLGGGVCDGRGTRVDSGFAGGGVGGFVDRA